MRALILPLAFLLAAAAAQARPECDRYRPVGKAGPPAPAKTLADGYEFIGGCLGEGSWQRVEGSAQMKKMLKGLGNELKQQLPVFSCFRSQESQNFILCNFNCKPFGPEECSGKKAANKSEHTYGVAADFRIQTTISPSAPNAVKDLEIFRLCRQLAAARGAYGEGRGGITVYGIDPLTLKAGLHYDTKPDWCNWGGCEKALGEGHCKRKKFEEKEARLMDGLAAAKELRQAADIDRLQKELNRLRADCKPGDISCRDSFKD